MKVNIYKGFILRVVFTSGMISLPVIILAIVIFILNNDIIVIYFILLLYLLILILTIIIALIFVNIKFEYKYMYFDEDSFSLINRRGAIIDFESSKIFIDNPVLGLLISPFHCIFNYEIKSDFEIKERNIEYTRVYLTIIDYIKIRKSNFKYVEF